MEDRIKKNLTSGLYTSLCEFDRSGTYQNNQKGWNDHLLGGKIIFSHRVTSPDRPDLFERLHYHDYYELVISKTEHDVEFCANGWDALIKRGNAILTRPGVPHMFKIGEGVAYDRYVLYFKDPKDISDDPLITDFIALGQDDSAVFTGCGEELIRRMDEVDRLLSNPDSRYSFSEARFEVARAFLTLSKNGFSEASQGERVQPRSVREIKNYVDEHFLEIRRVDQLCGVFFYSREHISRTFRKYYNTPIHEYLLCLKLIHCCSLLKKGETVEFAANQSGFTNMSNFVKLFKKHIGCTPSEYKRNSQ
ncbi:MAG: helix-turn-helix transcriptional regulator [Clostridia bacterium]|nr:helix-turn-helix transcriptional regulator [Clostridia bacterium]